MPQLIKNINGSVLDNFIGPVTIFNPIIGLIEGEDYINIHGLIGFIQDLREVEITQALPKPLSFGFKIIKPMVILNISY